MAKVWKGEGGIGPAPAAGDRPTMLIGGSSDVAFERAARHTDGTQGGGIHDAFAASLSKLDSAWSTAGRQERLRTMAPFYFSLGDDAEQAARERLGDYYAFLGDYAQQVVASAAKDPDTVKQYLASLEQAGADEVICFPASADPAQVELLAEAALG